MRNNLQTHKVRVFLEILSIKMEVKFPCKILFELHSDDPNIISSNIYDLRSHELIINQTLNFELLVQYNTETALYKDKKIKLAVMACSNNCRVPTGLVKFRVCNKNPNQKIEYDLPIEKCADKQACLSIIQWFQFLSVADENQLKGKVGVNKSGNQKNMFNSPRSIRQFKDISREYSGHNVRSKIPLQRITTQLNHYRSNEELNPALRMSQANQQLSKGYQKRNIKSNLYQYKGDNSSNWDHLIRIKEQNQYQRMQIQKLKQKCNKAERKQHQQQLEIKEYKDECQRIKNKMIGIESSRNEKQIQVTAKQNKIQQLKEEIRAITQKISDIKLELTAQKKKVQIKQNAANQQIKRLNDKYNSTDRQRKKYMMDYNELLGKMGQMEKQHQSLIRDKQHQYVEQKNKMERTINQLKSKMEEIGEENNQNNKNKKEFVTQEKIHFKKKFQLEENMFLLQSQLLSTKTQLKRQNDRKQYLQRQLNVSKLAEQQKMQWKRKHQQASNDVNRLKNRNNILEVQIQEMKKKINTLESCTNEQNIQNTRIIHQQYHTVNRETSGARRLSENVRSRGTSPNVEKYQELQNKFENQTKQIVEMEKYYKQEIDQLVKQKQFYDNQIEEFKWENNELNNIYQQSLLKLKDCRSEIQILNNALLQNDKRNKTLQQEQQQNKIVIHALKTQRQISEIKMKELNESIKSKQLDTDQIKKKQQLEYNLSTMQLKLKEYQQEYTDRIANLQSVLKDKDNAIQTKTNEVHQLELGLGKINEQLNNLKQEIKIKNTQKVETGERNKQYKKNLLEQMSKIEQLESECRVKDSQLQVYQREKQLQENEVDQLRKNNNKLKQVHDELKNEIKKIMQCILRQIEFQQINSGINNNISLVANPELSALQLEIISKHFQIITQLKTRINYLEQSCNSYTSQVNALRNMMYKIEEQQLLQLKKERESSKKNIITHYEKIHQLQEEFRKMELNYLEQMGKNDKLGYQIKSFEDFIEELNATINMLQNQKLAQIETMSNYQEQMQTMKNKIMKYQMSQSFKNVQINTNNQELINKLRDSLNEAEKKIIKHEKIVIEKDDAFNKIKSNLNNISNEKDKNQSKLSHLNQNYMQIITEKRQIEKKYKILQKDINQLNEENMHKYQLIEEGQNKIKLLSQKIEDLNRQFSQLEIQNHKNKQKIDFMTKNSSELEIALQDSQNKLKSLTENSNIEIKKLKQQIVRSSSDIEFKNFLINQNSIFQNEQIKQIANMKEDTEKSKKVIIQLKESLQKINNEKFIFQQECIGIEREKALLEEDITKLHERIRILQNDSIEYQHCKQKLQMRNIEINQLNYKLGKSKKQQERDMINSSSSYFKQDTQSLSSQNFINDLEFRRRGRFPDQMTDVRKSTDRNKWMTDHTKTQRLQNKIKQLQGQNNQMQNQFNFQRAQLSKQIQTLINQCDRLTEIIIEKDKIIEQLKKQAQQNYHNNQFANDLKNFKDSLKNSNKIEKELQDQMPLENREELQKIVKEKVSIETA